MANVYVYSGAAGTGTGADWTNAYTTLAAALTAKAAGDDFWVANDHAETQGSAMTLTPPGTAASPNRVICVNRAGSVPPVSADLRTTATITTTGGFNITIGAAHAYSYGITFSGASGAVSNGIAYGSAAGAWVLDNCVLAVPGTSLNANSLAFGGTTSGNRQSLTLLNTPISFGAVTGVIKLGNIDLTWRNTATAIQGSVPTTLFGTAQGFPGLVLMEGVDLSAITTGGTLVPDYPAPRKFILKDCKLGASVTVAATPSSQSGCETVVIRSDSGSTNYRSEKYRYEGTHTTETTIVHTGGASDGTTPISWKIVTTANSKRYLPFECLPISIWNETTGSAITLTVEGIWGGGAVPTNADIWMDAEYLGTSGFPLGNFATSGTADQLAAGVNLTSSTETWGGSTTKFKISVTITPQKKGPITVYVKAALASSTFYVDPKITVA